MVQDGYDEYEKSLKKVDSIILNKKYSAEEISIMSKDLLLYEIEKLKNKIEYPDIIYAIDYSREHEVIVKISIELTENNKIYVEQKVTRELFEKEEEYVAHVEKDMLYELGNLYVKRAFNLKYKKNL